MGINLNQFVDWHFWYIAWFPSNALILFHKSGSVCYYFSQISERLAWFDFEHRSKNLRCSEQRSKTLSCSERLRFLGASVECRVPKKWLKKSPIFRRSRFPNLHFYIGPRIRVGRTTEHEDSARILEAEFAIVKVMLLVVLMCCSSWINFS